MKQRIIDITQPLTSAIAVWPGDTEFKPFQVMRIGDGDSVNVGSVTMSMHTGTHTDAPYHIIDNAKTTSDLPLESFVGEALVVDLSMQLKDRHPCSIEVADLEEAVQSGAERLLLRTGTGAVDTFAEGAAYFSPASAEWIVARKITLVGLDTPSIDKADSKALPVHHIFINAGLCWLENLHLVDVAPGRYELIALPLKIEQMDAAPVRAILRTFE